jgi:predicted MFS family arabinose efflux permease
MGYSLFSMRARLLPLSFGNFVIGSGGFIVAGLLNELTADLHVPVQVAGQLLSGYSLALAIGAPLLAWLTSRIERRVLLASALLLYALLHFAAAAAPGYGVLMLLRVLTGAAAAIITPQAVATAGLLVPAHERGSAIGAVFLGFSLSTVLGVPLGSLLGAHFGWRAAFVVIGLLSLVGTAWVWLAIPRGLHVAPMDGKAWRQLGSNPVVLLVVATTVVHGTGQFVLYSYLAPVLKESLAASPQMVSMMFLWLGAAGVTGNMIGSRTIDRLGAPRVIVTALCFILAGLATWGLAHGSLPLTMLAAALWGLGVFAANMAQQARLVGTAPHLASASVALNSSGIYLGQALGGAAGGVLIAAHGFAPLSWVAAALVGCGILMVLATGRVAARRQAAQHVHKPAAS